MREKIKKLTFVIASLAFATLLVFNVTITSSQGGQDDSLVKINLEVLEASAIASDGEEGPCEYCLYGQGCEPTSLSNTCDEGPPCSNKAESCGGN